MRSIRDLVDTTTPLFSTRSWGLQSGVADRFSLRGELGYRLQRSLDRIEHQAPYSREYLLSQISGEAGCWCNFPRFQGDMAGRWVLAETFAHGNADTPPEHLASLVTELVDLQNTDGSFGTIRWADEPLSTEKAYGNGWLLHALSQYALTFSDEAVRSAAIRLGQNITDRAKVWEASTLKESGDHGYATTVSCFYHALPGVMTLHRLTGDKRLLSLAQSFGTQATPMEAADHSHMYLTIRRGMLMYFLATHQSAKIEELAAELDRFNDQWVTESGGVPERLVKPDNDWEFQDEGCSLFDWLLLCVMLHQATGDARWRDRAGLNLENQIFYNQTYNGGFGSVVMKNDYPQFGKEAPWCCSMFGPFGMIVASAFFVRLQKRTLTIQHLIEGEFHFGEQRVVIHRDDEKGLLRIDLTAAHEIETVVVEAAPWLEASGPECADATGGIDVPETRCIVLKIVYRLWCSTPGRAPCEITSTSDKQAVLFHGPWMLTHRHHAVDLALEIRSTADGHLRAKKIDWLYGLPGSGRGFRVTTRTPSCPEIETGFRSPGQDDRDVYLYALKEAESPMNSGSRVRIIDA